MMIINCRLLVPCRDRRMVLADDCILRFEVSSSKHFILFRTLGMDRIYRTVEIFRNTFENEINHTLKLLEVVSNLSTEICLRL